ncbi:hypothetical protein M595_1740 [Lyngbya aestuarii BL J]|uniref:Uncharacterized protein n=1 Tax=Lyngbya aestuarii BL J TaxID=1348334 RepID=U7Q8Y6_9CYAN|nr:hypothetical protein [Lyngbya aestuarii]ERT03662.1 hypothetical protein M595_6398 [Lyngbya aestuarii BL J]ERT08322.1 hypothetical protein M595_1740 [Lyngbya aestuarii BL J]
MNTQEQLKCYRIESKRGDRLSLVIIIVLNSLSMGLLPIAILPMSVISTDFIPHEASLWKD